MVKDFRVVLAPLPDGYVKDNSDVTGHVMLVTDEAKSGYKAIEVSLQGYATVRWSETHGSGDSRRTVTYYTLTKTTLPILLFFGARKMRLMVKSLQVLISFPSR